MKIIQFGLVTWKLLYPVLLPISYCIRLYTMREHDYIKNHPLFLTLCMFISEIVWGGGLFGLVLYLNREQRLNNTKAIVSFKFVNLLPKNKLIEINLKVYLVIIGVCIADLISLSGANVIEFKEKDNNPNIMLELKIATLYFTAILSYFWFRIKLFSHQILSIIIISIGIVFVNFYDILKLEGEFEILGCAFAMFFLFSVQITTEKWLMQCKYLNPFQLVFIEGIIGTIITILVVIIGYYIPCGDNWGICQSGKPIEDISKYIEIIEVQIVNFCLFFVSSGIYCVNLMMIKYYFTATHRSIGDFFMSLSGWCIWTNWSSTHKATILCQIIGYILVLVAVAIYNEIIVLYFCGLSENSNYEIQRRSRTESINFQFIETGIINLSNDSLLYIKD